MKTFLIGLTIDRYRFNPHFLTGTDDAQSDFSPICNQYFFKHNSFEFQTSNAKFQKYLGDSGFVLAV
jgi:hypothetical protein